MIELADDWMEILPRRVVIAGPCVAAPFKPEILRLPPVRLRLVEIDDPGHTHAAQPASLGAALALANRPQRRPQLRRRPILPPPPP
ncbi:MAG: hypothetical protein FWD12_10525, partial [Alphaproteobacteria bacterium]|nr:hypothetical protein [Alphaproteobacteria bacterium]